MRACISPNVRNGLGCLRLVRGANEMGLIEAIVILSRYP